MTKDYNLTINNIKQQGRNFTIGSHMACIDGIYYEIGNNAFSGKKKGILWQFYELVKCSDVKYTHRVNGFTKDLSSKFSYFFALNIESNEIVFVKKLKLQTIHDKHLDWQYVGTHIETYRYAREEWLDGTNEE